MSRGKPNVTIELPAAVARTLSDAAILVRDGADCDEMETRQLNVAIDLIDRCLCAITAVGDA